MFATVWERVCQNQGEIFTTVRGYEFTYCIQDDNKIEIFRDGTPIWSVTRRQLEDALVYRDADFRGNEYNNSVFAPSYVRGILSDDRIRRGLY